MPDLTLRPARIDARDERFLWRMLVEAAGWRPGGPKLTVDAALRDPALALYVQGWGREGDTGVVAELSGSPVGAAWWRFFTHEQHGYGFIEPSVPEVSIAVADQERGRGIGTVLLGELIARAVDEGLTSLSLSVEVDNRALRLYERLGFSAVRQVGNAWTMRLDSALA